MKIAIISDNNFIDKKGAFIATHNRIKYLQKYSDFEIESFLILEYENWLIRKLRGTKKIEKIKMYNYDGVVYKILWVDFSLLSYIIRVKFKMFPNFLLLKYSKFVSLFSGFHHISAHSIIPGIVALKTKIKYSVSYSVSWHGSDIHTEPKYNKGIEKLICKIILNASNNFFVSKKLLEESPSVNDSSKKVLYNGVDTEIFYKRTDIEKKRLKNKYKITGLNNVAFIGNLVKIKNVLILPELFNTINQSIKDIEFHVIGDGGLRNIIESEFDNTLINVKFYGNLEPTEIPEIINCMDLIVLPSLNEGMPLIVLEALACGTMVVGSNVGGTSEAIGLNNVIDLNDKFVNNFSKLILKKLNTPSIVSLPKQFKWCKTAEIEAKIYLKEVIN